MFSGRELIFVHRCTPDDEYIIGIKSMKSILVSLFQITHALHDKKNYNCSVRNNNHKNCHHQPH